jgi:ribosomal protein S18 acetylase RimI-like enzyme
VIRLRRFDPSRDDGDSLRALHARALRDAGTDPADVPATEDLDRVPEMYLDPGGEFLVGVPGDGRGEDPADVVAMGGFRPLAEVGAGGHEGFAGGSADPDAAVELFRIAVDPAHQGAGLGGRLLDELERRAAETGADWVVLTTAARQDRGVGLYRSRGYDEVDRMQQGPYELVRFERRLSPD